MCGEAGPRLVLDLGEHPVAHHFLEDPIAEEYVHPVRLCFCEACGLLQLMDPVPPQRLYTNYHWLSAWKPQPHVSRILEIISELPGLEPTSRVLEIGSNDGSFLAELKKEGFCDALGIEPAGDAASAAGERGVQTMRAFFDEDTAARVVRTRGLADLVVARQVLEHVQDLDGFARALRAVLRPGGHLVLEVPNVNHCLRHCDYSGLWEEHVNYFTPHTLRFFLQRIGVELKLQEVFDFCGEALVVVGQYTGQEIAAGRDHVPGLARAAMAFGDLWPRFSKALCDHLRDHRHKNDKIAIYGSGCRACSLINFAGLGPLVDYLLDDQPEKQGLYLPGARLPIEAGGLLDSGAVSLCLLMVNAESEEKVMAAHPEFLNRGGQFVSLCPPSPRLPAFWEEFTSGGEDA